MSEERKLFDCQRCGRCCRDLLSEDAGVLRGLTLLPEEKGVFKLDIITPAMGKGKNPKEPPFEILAYQLTEDKCHTSKKTFARDILRDQQAAGSFPLVSGRDKMGIFKWDWTLTAQLLKTPSKRE